MAKSKAEEIKETELRNRLIRDASENLLAYNKLLKDTENTQRNINYIKGEANKLTTEKEVLETNLKNLSGKELQDATIKIANLKNEINYLDEQAELAEDLNKIRREALNLTNLTALKTKSILDTSKKLGYELQRQAVNWLQQEKSVRQTELQMGILSNQASGFRDNIYKSSIHTASIGINTKELAELQGKYSDNIGRSVQLTDEQLGAMSELSKGTVLGIDGAAKFAGEMENFNISAKGSVGFIENMLSRATKMGVSSGKAVRVLERNLSIAQKYNFKGGVKGVSDMVLLATKFKLEMQDVASFADKLITPEGSVEAAARLQVLGGAWANLGNPFELMYKSRNDLTGLTEDIINATKATATFDAKSGDITIDPMELHRLREVANATGLNYENLAKTAKEVAKFDEIEGRISNVFDEEDKSFLSSLASFDKKTGQFNVTMQVDNKTVTESVSSLEKITPEIVKTQKEYQATLKERAKEAMTFNERFDALKDTFKAGLLPAFTQVSKLLENVIDGIAPTITSIAEFMAEWPRSTAVLAGVAGGLKLLMDGAMWFYKGVKLGLGFNSIASVNGGTGGFTTGKMMGKFGKGGKYAKYGKLAKGGGILSALGLGIDTISNFSDDSLSSGNAALKTLDQNKFMAGGAAIGSLFGGVGAIPGAAIGSLIDVISQSFGDNENSGLIGNYGESNPNNTKQDFISRPGKDTVSFSENDTLIGAKPNGPIDKILHNSGVASPGVNEPRTDTSIIIKNIEESTRISKNYNNESVSKHSDNKLSVEFKKPLSIEGKLNLVLGNNSVTIDLNDPFLMRQLSKKIQEELSLAIGGGKLTSIPVTN